MGTSKFVWLPVVALGWCSGFAQEEKPYQIKVGDLLSFRVLGEEKTNAEVFVDAKGMVTPKALPSIKAAGMTIAELQTVLRMQYSKALLNKDLKVAVIVMSQCKW